MAFSRSSGVLAHPTSFPGPYGVGELGKHAYAFVDWLASAGQKLWQVMPLGPTGYGDSPYQSFSAFAGNPYLISFDELRDLGLLTDAELGELPDFPADRVDYGWIYTWKFEKLALAYAAFENGAAAELRQEFADFKREEADWLEDYALFMALKDALGGAAWNAWEHDIRVREPQALARWRERLAREIDRIRFYQFLFFRQWRALRAYAHDKGIRVIGDIPIFVAMDSADAWSAPDQFHFDEDGHPTVVAGVPPDYFSETGQLWGNPLYRWDVMQQDGFRWWIRRFKGSLHLYDIIRIDHFRGFEAYWEIPAGEETAVKGRWVKAPGHELFKAVREALGELPIIAEDLGVITPEVERLRDDFDFPGMAVLQFAYGSGDWNNNAFLPQNVAQNRAIYTGTHDNDTTRGWFATARPDELNHLREFLPNTDESKIAWDMIELAWRSRADIAVVPLPDLLNLGTEARMNLPGSLSSANWSWRFREGALSPFIARRLRILTEESGR
ncbi:4-alpha-glucanotransferase [Deinobacterium chartae]|uniref:4-alpha-glucanotransferase n=1 Tax=Deinobacterium chartae TaxID=521158 RepID=A0A841HYD6_9DEIO|nr:4-alpha-glucanotransferase [Deinobacterium chartae]MBB6098551.1 4-alpha-glucanotransferase [Deinobacterium chartae]